MTEHVVPGPPPEPVDERQLGASGLLVSSLGLGTMTFGVETDETSAFEQLDLFRQGGGTLIDTADVYGGGESERIVGRWLADRRPKEMIVATKGRFDPPPGSRGASRRALVRSVDGSLSRLGIDAIDLYYVHGWDDHTPVMETLGVLADMRSAGKIHHVGWSNVTGWQLSEILTTARLSGFAQPCAVQPQYNLLDRGIETEVLPACLAQGVAAVPWSPLGGGWLTGKYERGTRPTGPTRLGDDPERGVEAYDVRNSDRTWAIVDVVADVAAEHGCPMTHVAIAWLLSRPGVASVLLGARTAAQLAQNLGSRTVSLTTDQVSRLTAISAPGLPPYPYGMVEEFCGLDVWKRLGTAGR